MKNYSKQREAILYNLSLRKDHPTAAQIYEGVRLELPNISLGTVYRNLADLVKSGEIICVNVSDGQEHYDYDTAPHLHLHCKTCGEIYDVPLESKTVSEIVKDNLFSCESYCFVINGLCKNCNQQ